MKRSLFVAAILPFSTQALAQIEADDEYKAAAQRNVRDRNQAPDLDVRTGFAGSGVQLAAGGDATSVTLTASRSWDASTKEALSFNTASLVVTTPITDKDKKEGAFLTEGGLPKSISLQGSFTLTISGNPPSPKTLEERRAQYLAAVKKCQAEAITTAARAKCTDMEFSTGPGSEIVDAWNETPMWFLGGSAAVGKRNFEYRSISNFQEQETSRTEYAFSAFGGLNPGSRPIYLGVGYEYRRQYKAPTSRTLCQSTAGATPQECFTGAFGEPEKNIDSAVFAVARWQWEFDLGRGAKVPLGVSIKAAYDLKDKIFGIGAPVYLFSDSAGLRGGIRVDWQDVEKKDERFSFRVFIGTPFSLFGS